MEEPQIAIIDSNTLSCIGMKTILQDIMPQVSVVSFGSFDDFVNNMPSRYIHYFVSLQIYMEHTSFFINQLFKTIVISGDSKPIQLTNVRMLNIHQTEKELIKQILLIQQNGHNKHPDDTRIPRWNDAPKQLTKREIEVLVLIIKGYLNKEIAEELHIGLSTVITHRKNIVEKLKIKSVSKLTIYAVMNGYIEADKI